MTQAEIRQIQKDIRQQDKSNLRLIVEYLLAVFIGGPIFAAALIVIFELMRA